ncbi:MAG TPA: hypothetical protein VMU44_11290 [Steroidobacteraceae bacterium]|nr:hypothetical protein [Steroidobacteraceae bacterium]
MTSIAGSSPVASLEGRIRQDQVQLNDWTTCVSARTPKGQAAIQKLSGEISAAKEQVAQALQTQRGAARPPAATASTRSGSLDVWA